MATDKIRGTLEVAAIVMEVGALFQHECFWTDGAKPGIIITHA